MPQQDEALKALVVRFKDSPERGFIPLASALLSRGHASEALRVAELGLQLMPESVEGRVERAAALLALGRPRVAYVELRRALCIDPAHRRGMRLLGKAFVDAGAPGRAAELLAKRSAMPISEDPPSVHQGAKGVAKADVSDLLSPSAKAAPERPAIRAESEIEPEPDFSPPPSLANVPDLFSDLTKDLGLGAAIPELARRVEVTQIIRRKAALPRPPRSESELREIEGPIVDTTQPGELETQTDEPEQLSPKREPPSLFNAGTNPALEGFSLDDEPLFQEHLPFDVRPVSESMDLEDTHAAEPPTAPVRKGLDTHDARTRGHSDLGDTLVEQIEPQGTPLMPIGGPKPLPPLTEGLTEDRPAKKGSGGSEAARADNLPPVVEVSRAARQRVEVVEPKAATSRMALAIVAAILMVVYFAGLAWYFAEDLGRWLPQSQANKGTNGAAPAVEGKSARAQREQAESE
jgi:hypothetical protein